MAKAVTLISGAERVKSETVIGNDLKSIRADYHDVLNIPGDATVAVNGKAQSETYKVAAGDEVVWSRPLGQKGC